MGRPDRPNIEGGTYHAMNRGNRKGLIFQDDVDRRQFLRTLVQEQEVHDVKIAGVTLMGNHFHLAVITPRGNLSEFMERFEGRYARYFNHRHGYIGHLFQRRFRHVCIESDVHLLTALCYLFMNPVTAGFVKNLEDYKWGSYAATAGFRPVPTYLSLEWLEGLFPTLAPEQAQRRLHRLMAEPKPVAAYMEQFELNVSGASIAHVIRSYTGEQLNIASLPRVYRTALRPPIEVLLQEAGTDLSSFIREARITYGYRNAEIARPLGLHPDTISRMYCDDRRRRMREAAIDPQADRK
jgi:putative transposase